MALEISRIDAPLRFKNESGRDLEYKVDLIEAVGKTAILITFRERRADPAVRLLQPQWIPLERERLEAIVTA